MSYVFSVVLQMVLIILLAPLVNGIIKKIKALSQKRTGPPVLQLYYDLYKLFRKDMVISETASWIYRVTPYITIGAYLTAALLVPVSIRLKSPSFTGDIILVIYLLALGRFFMTLAGLDTGSTFGGMGSSREMMIASLMEPSLLIAVFTLGFGAGSTAVDRMMQHSVHLGWGVLEPTYLLTFGALFIILIAETARIPVDDPATHLELTMVHEAMLLEYSGRYLALMELGAAVKQLLLITLIVNLFIPLDALITVREPLLAAGLSVLFYAGKTMFLAVVMALTEISTVKLRLFSIPNLAALSFILSLLGFFQYWVIGR